MHLDKTSMEILKYIKENRPASIENISAFVSDKALAENCVSSLKSKKLIGGLTPVNYHTPNGVQSVTTSPYEITADGFAYLEDIKRKERKAIWDNIHKWANTIIALLALLTAIPALMLSIKQLLR